MKVDLVEHRKPLRRGLYMYQGLSQRSATSFHDRRLFRSRLISPHRLLSLRTKKKRPKSKSREKMSRHCFWLIAPLLLHAVLAEVRSYHIDATCPAAVKLAVHEAIEDILPTARNMRESWDLDAILAFIYPGIDREGKNILFGMFLLRPLPLRSV